MQQIALRLFFSQGKEPSLKAGQQPGIVPQALHLAQNAFCLGGRGAFVQVSPDVLRRVAGVARGRFHGKRVFDPGVEAFGLGLLRLEQRADCGIGGRVALQDQVLVSGPFLGQPRARQIRRDQVAAFERGKVFVLDLQHHIQLPPLELRMKGEKFPEPDGSGVHAGPCAPQLLAVVDFRAAALRVPGGRGGVQPIRRAAVRGRVQGMVEHVEHRGQGKGGADLQNVLNGVDALVVFQAQAVAHRGRQGLQVFPEPLQGGLPVPVAAARMQDKPGRLARSQGVQESRVKAQILDGPLHHLGMRGVQNGVLAGMHRHTHAAIADGFAQGRKLGRQKRLPVKRDFRVRGQGYDIRADAQQRDALSLAIAQHDAQRAKVVAADPDQALLIRPGERQAGLRRARQAHGFAGETEADHGRGPGGRYARLATRRMKTFSVSTRVKQSIFLKRTHFIQENGFSGIECNYVMF